MMDWTDRHCRFFLRQVSSQARLYTEMITTGALIHGDVERHLAFSPEEYPVAAQLGGSEPADLAHCAKLVQDYGYDEVNLNCGCPSERVQRGAFGACLMAEPELVADCVEAMAKAVSIPVTVKHRTGIDRIEDYEFMARFVATVAEAGEVRGIARDQREAMGQGGRSNLFVDRVLRMRNAQAAPHLGFVVRKIQNLVAEVLQHRA